jgi:lipopolysaccharide transport protein LptA
MRILILVISILLNVTALAARADREKPCHITSDSAVFHQKTKTVEFFGHVISAQGSSQSSSDYAKGLGDASGRIRQIILRGKPAKYRTQSDEDSYPILAMADTIIDYADEDRVYLEGHAFAQHGTDSIEGDRICYHKKSGTIRSISISDKPTKTVFTLKSKGK